MSKSVLFFVFTLTIVAATTVFARNPIIQTHFTADPAPLVYDGRVYLFTTNDHDTASTFFRMSDWRVYSSADMVNWTDHGSHMSQNTFSWGESDAWAAQAIYRNGRFYKYVTLVPEGRCGRTIGVAVSDNPTGPFVDPIGETLVPCTWDYIDPTVLIDDDGQAYLYFGNPDVHYILLNEDMISYDKEIGVVEYPMTHKAFGKRLDYARRNTQYEEGPWLFERNDIYYKLFAAGGIPEHLAYSTSTSLSGPWVYQDTIMDVIQYRGAFTNHPGLINFKGKYFLFYHNAALPGGGGFTRSVCVEQFEFNPDGSIPLIKPTQRGIPRSLAPLNPYVRVEAETIAWSEGLKTAEQDDVGVYVTKINNGDHLMLREVDFGDEGPSTFRAIVASGTNGGSMEIRLGTTDGKMIGTTNIRNTGGSNSWTALTINVEKVTGVHDLYFVFRGGEGELFNFDWWVFRK